ncbi:hypothetical protein [Ammoniphilus sp. CFH 90114]|uniref:hypothetical protein n=1 Tax=Ammoniphilus sp. CFH 90114 TaxID=2493665 RepID=UPI0034CECDB0
MLIESEPDINVTIETDVHYVSDLVRLKKFDIILLDLYMPHINGADLAKKILGMFPMRLFSFIRDLKSRLTLIYSWSQGFLASFRRHRPANN